jgi:hypothetical protein
MSAPIAKTSRRDLFKTTASLGATASAALLGACATAQSGSGSGVGSIGADGTASGGSGSPIFNVPAITVPIVGTSSTFPVRRDLQRALGDEKKPWEIGKSFDQSAPIGPIHRVADMGPIDKAGIWLKVNGAAKQSANLAQMIWSVAEQISRLSEAFELKAGDIIYSGTPENVGPVVRGDVIECHIDGLPNLSIKIV